MDRHYSRSAFNCDSMQTPKDAQVKLLLRTGRANSSRVGSDQESRRNLYKMALLRFQADYAGIAQRGSWCQPQTGPKCHAETWLRRQATRAQHLESSPNAHQVSIFVAQPGVVQPSTSLEHRYYIHSAAQRFRIPRSSNGLVQPSGIVASSVKQLGCVFLLRGFRGSNCHVWAPWHLQYRPRGPVYFGGVCKCGAQQGYSLQYGWSRQSARQYFCRTAVEVCEI